jgi:catechol 2,3-dioxygenase
MPLPLPNPSPAFVVTRISHVVFQVKDLDESRTFYEELIGLVVTESDAAAVYLRGVEETCHHSVVLHKTNDQPRFERVGFRVHEEDDLDRAHAFFSRRNQDVEFAEVPHQGRTLRVSDDGRVPLEFCAHMPTQPRQALVFSAQRGAAATRLDHVQAHVTDVPVAASFYAELGFRVSEYASEDGTGDTSFRSIFLAKKGNANDIVLLTNEGPRLHHTAFVVHDAASTLLRVCDLAIGMRMREQVEWGPNRHGLGYEQFLYLRDPDGHRVELLSPPYQLIDIDDTPYGWSTSDPDVANLWGPSPPQSWLTEATPFLGVELESPAVPLARRSQPGRTRLPA